jgi:hypothetical protein
MEIDCQVFDTGFNHWLLRFQPGASQVEVSWGVLDGAEPTRGYPYLFIELTIVDRVTQANLVIATLSIYTGSQAEVSTSVPLRIAIDPRASILTIELMQLFVVQNGILSIEPD